MAALVGLRLSFFLHANPLPCFSVTGVKFILISTDPNGSARWQDRHMDVQHM